MQRRYIFVTFFHFCRLRRPRFLDMERPGPREQPRRWSVEKEYEVESSRKNYSSTLSGKDKLTRRQTWTSYGSMVGSFSSTWASTCQDVLEQFAIHITEQYPEVAQEVANNQDFEDMLNFDQDVEVPRVRGLLLRTVSHWMGPKSRNSNPERQCPKRGKMTKTDGNWRSLAQCHFVISSGLLKLRKIN